MSFYHPPPATIEVYSHDFTTIHKVPSSSVIQVPLPKLKLKRLVECLNFAAARDTAAAQITDVHWCSTACRAGSNCKFVHIAQPLRNFPGHPIHVHYIWQSLEAVTYARQWGGPCEDAPTLWLMNPPDCRAEVKRYDEQRVLINATLHLSAKKLQQHHSEEDEKIAHDREVDLIATMSPNIIVPATRLLKTVGASTYLQRRQSALKPDYLLTPCADYMCHNECRMGEECPGAHVINLDPSQTLPFVRRTLRHVKAASDATVGKKQNSAQPPSSNPRGKAHPPRQTSSSDGFSSIVTQNQTSSSGVTPHPSPNGTKPTTHADLAGAQPKTPPLLTTNEEVGESKHACHPKMAPTIYTSDTASSSPMQFNASWGTSADSHQTSPESAERSVGSDP